MVMIMMMMMIDEEAIDWQHAIIMRGSDAPRY